ncbi:MAG: XdhC family protein, partial [Acidimicrobiia bacterium]
MTPPIAAIQQLVEAEQLGAEVTCVEGPALGQRAVVERGAGIIAGQIPDTIRADVLADAEALMVNEQSRTLTYGDHRVFIGSIAPAPILVVFGAGHASQPLAQFSLALGFRVIVVDSRETWATHERFPEIDQLIVGWPSVYFDDHAFDERTYVALMNHDARFEEPVFPNVLGAPIRYIGAMGSRRTHRARVERLRESGWSDADVDRIHSPIGLDIGAETPEEMAISIVAEMTQVRYGHGTGMSLRGTEGRIHA